MYQIKPYVTSYYRYWVCHCSYLKIFYSVWMWICFKRCGGGVIWDTPTVILTAVVSVLVIGYMIAVFVKIDTDELGIMFGDGKKCEEVTADAEIQ